MPKSFLNGLHTCDKKLTKNDSIKELKPFAKAYVPLVQHIGKIPTVVVKVGDYVKVGSLLAKAEGTVSASIFSPVSGIVAAIETKETLATKACAHNYPHIEIDNDFKDDEEFLPPLINPTPEEIIQRVNDAGIVGMGGAGFPTAVKLNPPKEDNVDTLIINGAESEPYNTADFRVMCEYPTELLKGALYMAKALGVSNIYVGIENNKKEAIEILQNTVDSNSEFSAIKIVPLKTKYPGGAEKQLIYTITRRKVPAGCLPMKASTVVQNANTTLATYFAIEKGRKCYQRVVTISGKAIASRGNYWIRTGTTIQDLVNHFGLVVKEEDIKNKQKEIDEKIKLIASITNKQEKALARQELSKLLEEKEQLEKYECVKILNGGPMMGVSVDNLQVAVTKTTSAVLFLTRAEINLTKPSACINCSKCAQVCPMLLMPMYIDSAYLAGDLEGAKKYGAMDCILCGCCSYICPAKRSLVSSMILARKEITERGI